MIELAKQLQGLVGVCGGLGTMYLGWWTGVVGGWAEYSGGIGSAPWCVRLPCSGCCECWWCWNVHLVSCHLLLVAFPCQGFGAGNVLQKS